MDLQHRAAARGYGYVAASRFKFRSGCYLYGKLRRTDFLPVGEEQEDEVLERGYSSVSSGDSEGAGPEYAFPEDDEELDLEYAPEEGDANTLQKSTSISIAILHKMPHVLCIMILYPGIEYV